MSVVKARFSNVTLILLATILIILLSANSNNNSSSNNNHKNENENKNKNGEHSFPLLLLVVNANQNIVIAPRHCHGGVRHLHLAVGIEPSRSMTVSFASTWAFPDRVAPIAGVLVGKVPTTTDHNNHNHDYNNDYTTTTKLFLNTSRFVPEIEDPITYTIYMENHKGNESALYHAPYQHHITIDGLESDTSYYYLPVLGNRVQGIESLEKSARVSSIIKTKTKSETQQQQQQHPHTENIRTEEKLTNEQQQLLIDEQISNTNNNGNRQRQRRRQLSDDDSMEYKSLSYYSNYNDYDAAYLERDYDTNTEIVEVVPGTPMWDTNNRRLSPPPYDPTGIACIDATRIRKFQTAPEVDDDNTNNDNNNNNNKKNSMYPMVFGVIGDIGQFEHSQETLNHMKDHRKGMRAVLLVGDIAYPEFDGRKWDTFFDFLDDQSNFDEIPLMVAAGNHDIDKQYSRKEIFLGYEHRFRMPRVQPPELGLYEGEDEKLNMDAPPYPLPYEFGNSYYAFTYGPARHVVVNAYSDMSPGSTQYEWLKEELASIDRERTPWVLLTMHPPIYNTFALHHHDPQIFAAREHLEPLMIEHHVNIIFTGHIHAYQRTDYVAFNATIPTGPMHITIGAGGRACAAPFTNKEPEQWLMKRDATMYGYGRFVIENATFAEWQWIPISPSEKQDYNQVRGKDELHLPSLDHDKVMVENQYHVRLRQLEEEDKVR